MDTQINHRSYLVKVAVITFSVFILCINPAYSRGGGHGGGHHGGYHSGGHHGGYHHGGYHGGYHGSYRAGWGRGWGGYGGGYYYTRGCAWIPAHYNRYGAFVPGHRAC